MIKIAIYCTFPMVYLRILKMSSLSSLHVMSALSPSNAWTEENTNFDLGRGILKSSNAPEGVAGGGDVEASN